MLLYWILVNTDFSSRGRYVGFKGKIDPFSHFSLLTKLWMPSTWTISYTINLLELWFHLIPKINLLLSFNIPMLHPLHPKSLIINVYCFTSALMTSILNLLIVLATILHLNIVSLATSSCPKNRGPQSTNWKYNFKFLMEDYTRKWIKREKEEVDTLLEWVKAVRSLIQIRIESS